MIFGFFPFLFLPLLPILRYVSGHCPAIHPLHLFVVHLLAWWFCIHLSFLFLLHSFLFLFFALFPPQFLILLQFNCLSASVFLLPFFPGLVLLSQFFPHVLAEGRLPAGINCHSVPSIYKILLSLFLRSQIFKFLRSIKEFSFAEMCSATSPKNVICCHCWIHWKSSISCSRGMPHTS